MKGKAIEEELSPCPLTSEFIPSIDLKSPTTGKSIPLCVVSGMHMTSDVWTFCPRSGLPAIMSEYIKYISSSMQQDSETNAMLEEDTLDVLDPLLGKPITMNELKKVSDNLLNSPA